MRAADRLHPGFRQAEVPDLALLNQLFHRPGHVFDGHVRIHPMLVEQINRFDLEPFERCFNDLFDVRRLAVQAARFAAVTIETKLGGDDHLTAQRSQRFANKFLVCERAIDLGGVEERDALLDRRPDQGNHLLPVTRRAVTEAHAHAAQPDGRDFQIAVSKFALGIIVSFDTADWH